MDNLWIAALDPADRERIKPYLEEREVARGQMLYDAGEAVDQVWFPIKGVVSLMTVLPDDKTVETAAIVINAATGVERFAYVPSAALPAMRTLTSPNYTHRFIDNSIRSCLIFIKADQQLHFLVN